MYHAAATRYDSMPYRTCGKSGLKLSAVSQGLWHNFGDATPLETQRQMLRTAFDAGITHFDLANAVPQGKALYVGVRALIHQPSYTQLIRWIEKYLLYTLNEVGMGNPDMSATPPLCGAPSPHLQRPA